MVLSNLLLFKGGIWGLQIQSLRGREICTVGKVTGVGFGWGKKAKCVKQIFNKDIESYYDEYSGQLCPISTKTKMNFEA